MQLELLPDMLLSSFATLAPASASFKIATI
jgi:hypothetical protein